MKIPSTVKKIIDLYINENNLDKKQFYAKLMPIYERILREMNECCNCGGKDNSMAVVNMSLAAGFFALYDTTNRTLTTEKSLYLTDKAIPKSVPIITNFSKNHILLLGKVLTKRYNKLSSMIDKHKAKGEWLDSWSIDIKPFDAVNKQLSFDLIGCPIVKYAREYGYMDFMPAICGSDYITIRQLGAKLIRPQIVADGYERCKYTYVADKNEH